MKKILVGIIAAVLFTSCDSSVLRLGIVSPSIPEDGIPYEGGEYSVVVTSDTEWYVSYASEGCSVSQGEGEIIVHVSINESASRNIELELSTLSGKTVQWKAQQMADPRECTPTNEISSVVVNGVRVETANVSHIPSKVCDCATAYGSYFTWSTSDTGLLNGTAATACPAGWRLPTRKEWETIFGNHEGSNSWNSTGWTWTTVNSVNGALHSTSGLFLPAAGGYNGSYSGSGGAYWSRTMDSSVTACALRFGSNYIYPQMNGCKIDLFSVRCVYRYL